MPLLINRPSFLVYLFLLVTITSFLLSCNTNENTTKPIKIAPFQSVEATHQQVLTELPFENTKDFERADKGFIGTRKDPVIKNADGSLAMDLSWFDFLKKEAPSTVNPSLWRQSQLNRKHGLYEVTEGIYQVRGFDLANMTVVAKASQSSSNYA